MMILVVYRGHGIFHHRSVFFFLQMGSSERSLSSQIEKPKEETWCVSIVARVLSAAYRFIADSHRKLKRDESLSRQRNRRVSRASDAEPL